MTTSTVIPVACIDSEPCRVEQARRDAELQLGLLRAQLDPHFLYNTLAGIQYLLRKQQAAAAEFLMTQLVRYLRHAMAAPRCAERSLRQEFELADAYLQIARMRMGGRLSVDLELAEALHELRVPSLLLLPLVDNALRHGAEPKPGPVHIRVAARCCGEVLQLEVHDSGAGLAAGPATGGQALIQLRQRLLACYGEAAELRLDSLSGHGLRVRIRLPLAPSPSLRPANTPAPARAPDAAGS